jgi:hypothetical protein
VIGAMEMDALEYMGFFWRSFIEGLSLLFVFRPWIAGWRNQTKLAFNNVYLSFKGKNIFLGFTSP